MPCGNGGGGGGGRAAAVFVFGNQFDQLSHSFLHTRGPGGLGEWTTGFPPRLAQLKEQWQDDSHSHTQLKEEANGDKQLGNKWSFSLCIQKLV